MKKRCIMGGRFDPVHKAHIQTALDVCLQFEIDVLHFIPTYNPPHRDGAVAHFNHRCEMVSLAIKNVSIEKVLLALDTRESQSDKKSYTFYTIQNLQKQYPNDSLFLMMGSDAFLQFDTWYNWRNLLSLCTVVVDQRPGDSLNKIDEKRDSLLKNVPKALIRFCKVQQMAISSSQIRDDLKQGVDATGMLDANVLSYINNQKLYQ